MPKQTNKRKENKSRESETYVESTRDENERGRVCSLLASLLGMLGGDVGYYVSSSASKGKERRKRRLRVARVRETKRDGGERLERELPSVRVRNDFLSSGRENMAEELMRLLKKAILVKFRIHRPT
ncbi:unnamed protein product, partial [Dovyalis caffra]